MSSTTTRVALVTHGFYLGGGVSTVARWLRDALNGMGGYCVDVHDLATSSRDWASRRVVSPKSWLRPSLQSGWPPDDTTAVHWGANAVEIEAMRYRPRRELTRTLRSYDIVQIVSGSSAWAYPVAGIGIPTVLQVATSVSWERQWHLAEQSPLKGAWQLAMSALTSRVERAGLRAVDTVLVENSTMLGFARAAGSTRVRKAPPGVDTTTFSPAPSGWQGGGHVLSVCRLGDPRKGLDRTVRAYACMVRLDPTVPRLVLAGKGAITGAVRELLVDLQVAARVSIRSDVTLEDMVILYRDASVFLQTSYEEGLGMSVLEAMASGLPVVATETAGSRETVAEGVTGHLVKQSPEVEVPALVAQHALHILRKSGMAMAIRARNRCEEMFSTDVCIRRYIEAYDDLLATKRGPNNPP